MSQGPLELATFQMQVENERERRFLDALTDENRAFVVESNRMRAHLLHSLQVMLTETDHYMRMLASTWVAEHAVDVGERNATVMKMRVHFAHRDPTPAIRVNGLGDEEPSK
jgi:hypothetical protein